MRKIYIFLIIVILLFSSSCNCKNKDNDNKSNQHEFTAKETVLGQLKTYHLNFSFTSSDNKVISYEIMENDLYYYCKESDKIYYIEKASGNVYTLLPEQQIKTYEQSSTYDYNKNKTVIFNYLTSHYEKVNSEFIKEDTTSKVGTFDCNVYSYKKGTDRIYSVESYYVDTVYGLCLKNSMEAVVSSTSNRSYWEIGYLSFDENNINSTLASYNLYTTEYAPIEYSSWPTVGLGSILPEFKNGQFDFGYETTEYILINILNVTLPVVQSYCRELRAKGFAEGKAVTNVVNQYVYLTYTEDYKLVRVKFEPTTLSVTIKVSQSTKEAVEAEIENLK
jgi:hypothetical protein